jgi:hypothetical protein
VRSYTVDKVRPHLIGQMDRQFLPQTVPAFAATETLNELRKKYPTTPTRKPPSIPPIFATGRPTGRRT